MTEQERNKIAELIDHYRLEEKKAQKESREFAAYIYQKKYACGIRDQSRDIIQRLKKLLEDAE